MLDDATFRHF